MVAMLGTGGEWSPLADTINHRPSPNYGYGSARPNWRAVTWHITEGSLEGTLSWLTSPESQASAHIVVARDGALYSLVSLTEAAWAQGNVCTPNRRNPIIYQTARDGVNPNLVSYSIECIGYSSWGRGGSLTQPQSDALVRVTAYLCWRSRLSADRTHILGHYEWDSCTRSGCPGFALEEWADWITRVNHLCRLWRGW